MYTVSKITATKISARPWTRTRKLGLLSLAGLGVQAGFGQTFQNLDFEAAGSQTIPPSAVWLSWSLAATGWQHAGGANTFFVYHDSPQTNLTQTYSLVDSASTQWKPLAGNFSLAISSGYYSVAEANSTWVHAEISQQGLVPENAHSFQLLAEGHFTVYINSTEIPMSNLGGNVYGGDVSAYAGQVVTLEIANASTEFHDPVMVDNLTFSTQVVPEPGTFALLGAGLALLLARSRVGGRKA